MPSARLDGFVPPPATGRRADGFHRLRAQRYARGRTAETHYRDSFDHAAMRDRLVLPFRRGLTWVRAVHDVEWEQTVDVAPEPPPGPVDAVSADPASEENTPYVGGQRLYRAEVESATLARWVLENADLGAPVLTTRRVTGAAPSGTPTASG